MHLVYQSATPNILWGLPSQLLLRRLVRNTSSSDAVLLAWPLACGPRVAERTEAVALKDGVLVVRVADDPWRKELQQFSRQYLSSLEALMPGVVKKIEFLP